MNTPRAALPLTVVFWLAISAVSFAQVAPPFPPPASDEDQGAKESAPADDDASSKKAQDPAATQADGTKAEQPMPLRRPKLLNLRYDEDFSYLSLDPESYEHDLFDPLKNIDLGGDWRLNLGGEFRVRMEAMENFAFGARRRSQDTFQTYRYMLHFDLRHAQDFRIFLQGASIAEEDRTFGPRPIDENLLALQQLFVEFKPFGEGPLTLRVGRQDLLYGAQRFVSPLDWASTRRRFDAAKIIWKNPNWQFDFFFSRPIPVQRRRFDDWRNDFDFYGAYWTYSGIPDHTIDVFSYAVHDTNGQLNPNRRFGDVTRFTFGGRFAGKAHGFDYDALLVSQWGTWAGDRIEAWAWTIDGGYTFHQLPWKPRLGAAFDWASGDNNPRDGSVQTFDQLFPLGHAYLGYMDFVARQNIQAANVNLTAWPIPKTLRARAAYHAFWLESSTDALYNAAGRAGRRDPLGRSSRRIGQELDLTLLYKVGVHQALLLGYSHFFPGQFLRRTGRSEDADFIYVQYQFKF